MVLQSISAETVVGMVRQQPEKWALFLDIDGTLIDLAPTPDTVIVPGTLPDALQRVSARLGGALALVTGRSLNDADSLFAPHVFPAAGLHGAEIRAGGSLLMIDPGADFTALKAALAKEFSALPGVLVEDKGAAVAAHFRLAPQFEKRLQERMHHYAGLAGPKWALQFGKMVFELRPARSSKGDALEHFLQTEPFLNRVPIALGDDLTDESMFAIANARGGTSIQVGTGVQGTCATARLPSPDRVRALIAELAA